MRDINEPIKTHQRVENPLHHQISFSGQERSKWCVNDGALNAVGPDGDSLVQKLALKGKTGAGRLTDTFPSLWKDT